MWIRSLKPFQRYEPANFCNFIFVHFAKIAITWVCMLQSGWNLEHVRGSKGKYQYQFCGKAICDWIWQNPASTHRTTLRDMAISSINCIMAPWWIMLKKRKLQQVLVYSLAIIVWVNNFQTPEIQAVLSSFFRDGNDIAGGIVIGVVVIGVVGGERRVGLI